MGRAHWAIWLLLASCRQEPTLNEPADEPVSGSAESAQTAEQTRRTKPPDSEGAAPTPPDQRTAHTTPAPAPTTQATPSTSAESKQPSTPGLLWEAREDLDGDGNLEHVRLIGDEVVTQGSERADETAAIPVRGCRDATPTCSAVLHAGRAQQEIVLTPGYFGGIDLSVIDIDKKDKRKELLFRRRTPGHVDPPFVFTVGIYDGKKLHWQELESGAGYDSGETRTPGNGILETEYDACYETTIRTYRLSKNKLRRTSNKTKKLRDPSQCAACPYVYVEVEGDWVKQGEILRNLSSPELNTQQGLPLTLPRAESISNPVHVQLREEKAETTYLDSVWLQVDGDVHPPIACGEHAYCVADGRFHKLAPGEALDLYFALPASPGPARLEAIGHYVPLHQ